MEKGGDKKNAVARRSGYLYTKPQLTIEHTYVNIENKKFAERQEGI